MRYPTCPSHPGIRIDHRPCYRCPQPEEAPMPTLASVPEPPAQLTLSDEVFKPLTRKRQPAVKLALSGGESLTMEDFDRRIARPDGSVPTLAEGLVVEFQGTAYIKALGQEYTTKGETVLVVKLACVGLESVDVTGELWEAGE